MYHLDEIKNDKFTFDRNNVRSKNRDQIIAERLNNGRQETLIRTCFDRSLIDLKR